ncbi:MAG: hypothetical protein V3R73_06135 [Sphingomonadales bacterium]
MKQATTIAVVLLALVAVAHLARIIMGLDANVGAWAVPMWISYLGVLIPGGLSFMVFREHQGD